MTEYQLTENGTVLASGSILDCWKAMVNLFGGRTAKELFEANIKIEAKE